VPVRGTDIPGNPASFRSHIGRAVQGKVQGSDGREIDGPQQAPFEGRNKPHRGDRQRVSGGSTEQIATRLRIAFPHDESIRISHRRHPSVSGLSANLRGVGADIASRPGGVRPGRVDL